MKKFLSCILVLAVLLASINAFNVFGATSKYGFDVSKHNGADVDFSEQISNGKSFVMIRLGNYNILDPEFWNNVKKASEAGIDFGVYMYSAAFNDDEARIEADFTIKTLSEMPEEYRKYFTLPVAYDMEASGLKDFSKQQLSAQVVVFCEKIIDAGYIPMVYSNLDWFTNRLDIKSFADKGYKIWFANYVSKPDFSSKRQVGTSGVYADMWQYKMGDAKLGTFDENFVFNPSSLAHLYRQVSVSKATLKSDGKSAKKCIACGKIYSQSTVYKPSEFKLSSASYTYNGNAKKPSVTVKDSNGKTISNTNYTLSYSNNTKVGKASVKISFKGLYSGSKVLSFKINPKGTNVSSLYPASKAVTVKWKKQSSQTSGYQIQLATDSKFTKNVKSVTVASNATTSKKITKLKGKTKYYVRIRTYKTVSGTKFFSSWCNAKSFTSKK